MTRVHRLASVTVVLAAGLAACTTASGGDDTGQPRPSSPSAATSGPERGPGGAVTAEADGVMVAVDQGDLDDGAELYAVVTTPPVSPVPLVGPVVDIGTRPAGALRGTATVEFPAPWDAEPGDLLIAYWDETIELWIPYPTSTVGSRLVAETDHFTTFSVIDWRTWTEERNPVTAFVYGSRVVTGQRGTAPRCEGRPPGWLGDPIVAGTFDDQLLVCVESSGDDAVVRAVNNRGIPAVISSNLPFSSPPRAVGETAARDLIVLALGDLTTSTFPSPNATVVPATAEVELRFSRPDRDTVDALGDRPALRLDVDREARSHLVAVQFWLEIMKIIGVDVAKAVPYLDCAVGLAGPGPDGAATDDVLRTLEMVIRRVISCVTSAVDADLQVSGRSPSSATIAAKRALAAFGRLTDSLLVADLYFDMLDDVRRGDGDSDVIIPLCQVLVEGEAVSGCDVVIVGQTGVGALVAGRDLDEQATDPVLGPPTDVYVEPSGYTIVTYDFGAVQAEMRDHRSIVVRAAETSGGALIVTEGGIGVGAEEVDAVLAHPGASQPCGPGTYLNWGNVTMFIEPTTGRVSDIWVFALGPYTSDCSGDPSDF